MVILLMGYRYVNKKYKIHIKAIYIYIYVYIYIYTHAHTHTHIVDGIHEDLIRIKAC